MDKQTREILESMIVEIQKNNHLIQDLQQMIQGDNVKNPGAFDDLEKVLMERSIDVRLNEVELNASAIQDDPADKVKGFSDD